MMMKMRNLGPLVVLLILLATAVAVPNAGMISVDEEYRIVCANSILADFTENVVDDLARVDYLMPAGVCPSHYDSRPSDATLVAEADIIVMMGWEGWLNGLIESTGNSEAVLIKCAAMGEQNLPEDVKDFVDHIAAGLSEVMEDDADDTDIVAAILRLTNGRGVDVAFEAAGAPETPEQAAEITHPGGKVIVSGVPSNDTMTMKAGTIRRKGLTIKLVRRMKHTYPRAIRLVQSGAVDVKPLITHIVPLERVAEAFETVAAYDDGVIKAIIRPDMDLAAG